VSEASWDAWIKYYRPNENSSNATISYYNKGSLIAALLDLHILFQTKGEKSLDDVFRLLYEEYYKKLDRGFTDEELQRAFESVDGLPLEDFFKNNIYGTLSPDYGKYFEYAGLKLVNLNDGKNDPWLGISLSNSGGRATVNGVTRNSPAWKQGIYVNDEIIAINNFRVAGDISGFIYDKKPGDKLNILVSRDGILRTIEITLAKNESVSYRLVKISNATEQQKFIYKKWTKADF
jgi:predicted metalloprotease with PDZ domain